MSEAQETEHKCAVNKMGNVSEVGQRGKAGSAAGLWLLPAASLCRVTCHRESLGVSSKRMEIVDAVRGWPAEAGRQAGEKGRSGGWQNLG